MTRQLVVQDAIAAAVDDIRVVAAVLSRTQRHGIVGLDLRELAGGQVFLRENVSDKIADAYTGALDAALARLPGLVAHGYVIHRVS
jgi:hypothetical protein